MKKQFDLRIVLLEITQKCNAACEHCGSRCDIHSDELLSAEAIINAFADIKENIGTDPMVNVTGGEPLMRKDLFDIMTRIHDMGFDWGMVTNGTLINDSVIEKMKQSGMKTITISVDGMKVNHEALRHLPGSFDTIMNNLRKLKAADFLDCIQVTFTSNKKNYQDFPALYEVLDEIGIDSVRTSFVDPIGRAEDHAELMMDRQAMQFMIDFANARNKEKRLPVEWGCCHYLGDKLKRKFFCFAGIYAASILYNGDIFVCPNVPRRPELIQGNILRDSFSKVWKEGFGIYRDRPVADKCRNCQHFEKCGGDSMHTFDFDNNTPKFCYKDIFEMKTEKYENWLKKQYGDLEITRIADDASAPVIYIEPDAYEEIKIFFHMGRRHPLSMFEQQLGLAGFKVDTTYVVRYTFPVRINSLATDLSTFTTTTIKDAVKSTEIIKRNIQGSDDKLLAGARHIRFLGFIHSHPAQEDLQYSVGDELLHKALHKRFGDYIGLLINPQHCLLGAYVGDKNIVQGDLRIAERKERV